MSPKKLLLLSCRSPFLDNDRVFPPLANHYLKSYINYKAPQHTVVLAGDNYNINDLEQMERFDVIGISVMTPQRHEALTLCEAIKTFWPEKKLVIGGPHAQNYTEEVKAEPWDHIVTGDGEKPLLRILNSLASPRILRDDMTKHEVFHSPRPDRRSTNAQAVLEEYNYQLRGEPAGTIMTGRGCPEKCGFCEAAQTRVRRMNPVSIGLELDDLRALGYKGVYIFDDLFALSTKIAEPICKELARRNMRYRCNGHAKYFDREMALMLAQTGCVEIAFGHESGSQKILDVVGKRATVAQNYASVALANEVGLRVKSFLMLGLPGEDIETIMATEKFIVNSGIDDFQLAIYYPYKGTPIRDRLDRGERLDLQFTGEGLGAYGQRGGSTECVVRTKALSGEDLVWERDRIVLKYRPDSHMGKWKN